MEERLLYLLEAIKSHVKYCNEIENPTQTKLNGVNFDILRAIFDGFNLAMRLDEFLVIKDNQVVECKLINGFFKDLANIIAKYNGQGFTLGELSYKDEYELFKKIRNKLAHGDFIVENGVIIFEENNKKGKITVSDLSNVMTILDTQYENYIKSYTRIKEYYICTKPQYFTQNNYIDNLCDNICIIEVTDFPIFPREKTADYCNEVKEIHRKIEKTNSQTKEQVMACLEKLKEDALKQRISISYNVKTLRELEYYEKIKEKYIANIEINQRLDDFHQMNMLVNYSYRIGKGQFQQFDIQKGLLDNSKILEKYSKNPNTNFFEIVSNDEKLFSIMLHDYDITQLTSYLVGFNSVYQYGLEKGLTTNENYSFISIYKGESLDFSKLNLTYLESDIIYKGKTKQINNDILEYEIKQTKKIDDEINKLKNIINNVLKSKNPNESKIEESKQQIIILQEEKNKLLEEIKNIKYKYANFDIQKYNKNLNIIFNIRNAIAHGGIYIDSYSNDLMETDIIIENIHEGVVCYKKQIKVKDFVRIFEIYNLNIIQLFILNNIKNKHSNDKNYIEKAKEKILRL